MDGIEVFFWAYFFQLSFIFMMFGMGLFEKKKILLLNIIPFYFIKYVIKDFYDEWSKLV